MGDGRTPGPSGAAFWASCQGGDTLSSSPSPLLPQGPSWASSCVSQSPSWSLLKHGFQDCPVHHEPPSQTLSGSTPHFQLPSRGQPSVSPDTPHPSSGDQCAYPTPAPPQFSHPSGQKPGPTLGSPPFLHPATFFRCWKVSPVCSTRPHCLGRQLPPPCPTACGVLPPPGRVPGLCGHTTPSPTPGSEFPWVGPSKMKA